MRSFTLLSAGVLALCGTLLAEGPEEFPILGGSFAQTMRIAVTAGGRLGCSAVVGFRNGQGNPPEPDKTLILGLGHTGFMDLNLSVFAKTFGQRVEFRPVVHVTAGQCSASVEVFEEFTGRTTASLLLFGLIDPPEPGTPSLGSPPEPITPSLVNPPDPVFPSLGAARSQKVRLGVVRTVNPPDPVTPGLTDPPDPECQAVLGFTDANGNAIGAQKVINLLPGHFDFLDLDLSRLPGTFGGRVAVRPVLHSAGGLGGCHASVQVFEPATGWTSVIMRGADGPTEGRQ